MSGHSYVNVLIHVAFSTKDRAPLILPEIRGRLNEYLCGIARKEFGSAITVGGSADHIHGLLSIHQDMPVSRAIMRWKSLSSGWIHDTFPACTDFAWQSGYGAFSVSQSNLNRVANYINGKRSTTRS